METIFKISNKNKYHKNYSIETLLSPVKSKNNKTKENISNDFFQDRYYNYQSKTRPNLPINQKNNDSKINSIFGNQFNDSNNNYSNINLKNINQQYHNNYISIASTLSRKNKNRYENDKNKKYIILNPFREKRSSSSNRSLLVPKNENQISILKKSEIFDININRIRSNENSLIIEASDKKVKRNNTVYIKKHFSKDKNLKNKKKSGHSQTASKFYINKNMKTNNKNDDIKHFNKSNIKSMVRSNSSYTMRKKNKGNQINKNKNTNNINSNVNIFHFDMQYNNTPNYYIKNSKMYNPYFNNYLPCTLNIERDSNNSNNLISIRSNKYKSNENDNDTIIKLSQEKEEENESFKMEKQLFEQSAIIIQSVFRGCLIRSQINNLLKAFKAIEFLDFFFKYKFWKYFKNILSIIRSNIINNDSKMSISSISCISALFNSNKNNVVKTFNSKLLYKEIKESFSIINHINNKYLETFQNINNTEIGKSKTLIWNKKKINKNNNNTNIINQKLYSKKFENIKKSNLSIKNNKEKNLKILVIKNINNTKIFLLKNFMKFYFNGLLFNIKEEEIKNENEIMNQNLENSKIEKLKIIIKNKGKKSMKILYIYFYKFYFKGLLRYMENNRYYMINGGRLKDINSNPLFIYKPYKSLKDVNKIENNNQVRNIKITLNRIKILRKIIYKKRTIKKDEIKFYFYKFHLKGIMHYMKNELKKRIIIKKILALEDIKKMDVLIKDKNSNKVDGDNKLKNERLKILKRLIYKNNKIYLNICKNIFNKWNLRTKIFSIIAIDKEKKKKRRIKKRNNKKLGSNNMLNNPNNNININISTPNKINTNNTNKKIINNSFSSCPNTQINLNNKINEIIPSNLIIAHPNSVIFSNNLKIDYYKLNKFIEKINGILTKKYYFFSLIYNNYKKNKKSNENIEEKDKINDDIDFFVDDSSDQSED